MKTSNFLLIAFLLLSPPEYFIKHEPKSVFGDFAPNTETNRKQNNAVTDYQDYYRQNFEYDCSHKDNNPVKINYESSKEEKCVDGKKIKVTEAELCSEEVEAVKKVAAKWQSAKNEKLKKPEYSTCRPIDQVLQDDLSRNKFDFASAVKEETNLCADCEKCEVQVKTNGEGILLRCQECRQVPSSEIIFPTGNNRKIIKLP